MDLPHRLPDPHLSLATALLVLLGGFLGGAARFLLAHRIAARLGDAFPWGTLAVNVSGCLAIGLLAGLAPGPLAHAFLVTGFCGGYTTVSTFALQSLALGLEGRTVRAVANLIGSTLACLAAVGLGLWLSA